MTYVRGIRPLTNASEVLRDETESIPPVLRCVHLALDVAVVLKRHDDDDDDGLLLRQLVDFDRLLFFPFGLRVP